MLRNTIVVVALVTLSLAALTASTARLSDAHGNTAVLFCDIPPGSSGDNIAIRGIVFTVDKPFVAIELMISTDIAGDYSFTIELRRSTGFTAPVAASSTVNATLPAGDTNIAHFDFDALPVVGRETFSLKFSEFTVPPPETTAFFNKLNDSQDCPDTYETAQNDVADPELRGAVPWILVRQRSSTPYVWGDTTCNGSIGPDDALNYVQQFAGTTVPIGNCPEVGSDITIHGQYPWGDWNCSQAAQLDDALLILTTLADVEIEHDVGRPQMGAPLAITGPG